MKYIYKMSFYDNQRCIKSHTDMYFVKEEHTRWGHDFSSFDNPREVCKIFVIEVDEDSNEYKSAVSNSRVSDKEEEEEMYECPKCGGEENIPLCFPHNICSSCWFNAMDILIKYRQNIKKLKLNKN